MKVLLEEINDSDKNVEVVTTLIMKFLLCNAELDDFGGLFVGYNRG